MFLGRFKKIIHCMEIQKIRHSIFTMKFLLWRRRIIYIIVLIGFIGEGSVYSALDSSQSLRAPLFFGGQQQEEAFKAKVEESAQPFDGLNYYLILGLISKNASGDDIKRAIKETSGDDIRKAYRILVKIYHPDKERLSGKASTGAFQAIQGAYETLSNPNKREIYNKKILIEIERERKERISLEQKIIKDNVIKISSKYFEDVLICEGKGGVVNGVMDEEGRIVAFAGNSESLRLKVPKLDERLNVGTLFSFTIRVKVNDRDGDIESPYYKVFCEEGNVPTLTLQRLYSAVKKADGIYKKRTAILTPDEKRLILAIVMTMKGRGESAISILLNDAEIPVITPLIAEEYLKAYQAYSNEQRKLLPDFGILAKNLFYRAKEFLSGECPAYVKYNYFGKPNSAIDSLQTNKALYALDNIIRGVYDNRRTREGL